MIDITFRCTSELRFRAELIVGTWVDTTLLASPAGPGLNVGYFTLTDLDVSGGRTSHVFRAEEDPGDPFMVLQVTNNAGDLEVTVPGQASVTIPTNNTIVISCPRSSPSIKVESSPA